MLAVNTGMQKGILNGGSEHWSVVGNGKWQQRMLECIREG